MEDKIVSNSDEETVNLIKSCFGKLKEKVDIVFTNKNAELETLKNENSKLKQDLELSESRRQTAEDMVAKIRDEVKVEMKNAYDTGYKAALNSGNPQGGTTMVDENAKRLVLSNQN